jgi:hypothetical protein
MRFPSWDRSASLASIKTAPDTSGCCRERGELGAGRQGRNANPPRQLRPRVGSNRDQSGRVTRLVDYYKLL